MTGYGAVGVVLAGCSAIPFWLIESFWKFFQKAHETRLGQIEACMKEGCANLKLLQMWSSWYDGFSDLGVAAWLELSTKPHVLFPHIFLFGAALLLALTIPPRPHSETGKLLSGILFRHFKSGQVGKQPMTPDDRSVAAKAIRSAPVE